MAEAWCAEHGVEASSLPPFVEAFAEDVAKVREADLRHNGGGEIGALQHRLNNCRETGHRCRGKAASLEGRADPRL